MQGSDRRTHAALLSSLLFCAGVLAAEDPAGPQTPVETFTPPTLLDLAEPEYPVINQRTGREGWVQLSFMVGPTGEPYDIAVVSSSGDDRFEGAAMEAAAEWTFEPARLGDTAIDAGMQYMVMFELEGGTPGARSGFVSAFRRLQQAIQKEDRPAADRQLERLRDYDDRNLYEEANYHLAEYYYALAWGTEARQYAELSRATAMDEQRGFLPDEVLTPMLKNRFVLELSLSRFADARQTGELLKTRQLTPDEKQSLTDALAQIDALAASDQPVSVNGAIGDGTQTFHRLLRSRFHFQDINGEIAELRLHCDQEYAGFRYQTDMSYTLSDRLTGCMLRIIGNPGTTFTLVET